jgi:hypothetical protein
MSTQPKASTAASNASLRTIRLELARMAGFPEGSSQCGYEFTAPLDAEGHLDLDSFKQHRDKCRVHRFWAGEKTALAAATASACGYHAASVSAQSSTPDSSQMPTTATTTTGKTTGG